MGSLKRPSVLLIILVLVLAGLPSTVFPHLGVVCPIGRSKGDTLVVNASGGGDYIQIQLAVDNANNGDTIVIEPGTYLERVLINKSIRLIGDPGGVIINGEGLGHCLSIMDCDNNEIRNITTCNGDYGIYISNSNGNNLSSIFSYNSQEGIHITNAVGNRLENISNWNNPTRGIYIKYSNGIEIVNSTLTNNGVGLEIYNSAAVRIENVSHINNGIKLTSSSNIMMKNSSISAPDDPDLTVLSNSDLSVLNSSFDKLENTTDGSSYVNVRWFFTLTLNNTLAWPVENAVVRIKDNANGSYDNNFSTDAGGKIPKKILTEYTENNSTKVFFSPYNVSVSQNGYHTGYVYPAPEMQSSTNVSLTLKDSQSPVADAGNDISVNQHTLVSLDGSGSQDNLIVENYTWYFTYNETPVVLYGQSPAFLFDLAGYYPIRMNVTDHDGNLATDLTNITVNDTELPVANAGPDQTVDQGDLVTFIGNGSTDNVAVTNYTWTFNDSTVHIFYGVESNYTFQNAGEFIVALNVSDIVGNWHTDTMTITVNDKTKPVADAGPDQTVNQGDLVTFNGSGSRDNMTVENYTWNFTDGGAQIVYGIGATYTFNNAGVFVVTLTAKDAAGNTHTDTVKITVNDTTNPIADAGIDKTVDQGDLVTFNGVGSIDIVGVINYTWTFTDSDAQTLYGIGPNYTFDNAGEFIVTLTIKDAAGNTHTDTVTITVNDKTAPVANGGSDQSVNQGDSVTFNGSGSTDNMGIDSYNWTFDDGGARTLYGVRPSYTFKDAGSFAINLNVSDAAGNWHVGTFTVNVKDITEPTAVAGPDRTLEQDGGSWFDGLNSTDNVGVFRYLWTYFEKGAKQSLSGGGVWIIFHFPGIYKITLEVTDKEGNLDLDFVNVTVLDTKWPVADAGLDITVSANELTRFNGSASSDNLGIYNYTWNFKYDGKDKTLYGEETEFYFLIPGTYNITLRVTDQAGHEALDTFNITVIGGPSDLGSERSGILDYWWILVILLVLVGSIVFVMLFFKRKRSGYGTEDEGPSSDRSSKIRSQDELGSGPIIPLASPAQLRKKSPGTGGPVIEVKKWGGSGAISDGFGSTDGKTPSFEDPSWKGSRKRGRYNPDEPSISVSEISVPCKICFGVIKAGLALVKCKCGKHYHHSCARRVGECPACGYNFLAWKATRDESPTVSPPGKKHKKPGFDVDSTFIPLEEDKSKKGRLFLDQATYIDLTGKDKKLPIDEIFLMTSYGLLIKHYTFSRTTELDEDVLSSMLIAVKNFMGDAIMKSEEKIGADGDLKKIDYGNISVMFANGKEITIVAVGSIKGIEGIGVQLDRAVELIEKRYQKILADWDGEVKKLEDVKTYMEELVLGNYMK